MRFAKVYSFKQNKKKETFVYKINSLIVLLFVKSSLNHKENSFNRLSLSHYQRHPLLASYVGKRHNVRVKTLL